MGALAVIELQRYVEERSIPVPEAGCWLWLLSIGSHGYGQATAPWARVDVAHRVAYRAFIGEIPEGMLVQHRCDERTCVAPHHLVLGTDATNAVDKQRKGRAAKRLSSERVALIRERASTGTPIRQLAREMSVSQRCVQFVVRRRTWGID